jgi:hypothetical protein
MYVDAPCCTSLRLKKRCAYVGMLKLNRRKRTNRGIRRTVRVRGVAEIREGIGVFVLIIIAAATVAIAGGVGSYILGALGPAVNSTILSQGQQAITTTMSAFGLVVGLVGGLVLGIIAFGFLKRIWKEFVT